jgi:hypothetical protein
MKWEWGHYDEISGPYIIGRNTRGPILSLISLLSPFPTLQLRLSAPELWENKFLLFKLPTLWHYIIIAVVDDVGVLFQSPLPYEFNPSCCIKSQWFTDVSFSRIWLPVDGWPLLQLLAKGIQRVALLLQGRTNSLVSFILLRSPMGSD